MLFSSRNQKLGHKNHKSASKDSKGSSMGKQQQKIYAVSANQMKLRQAINSKFQKSKIKHFKYMQTNTGFQKQRLRTCQNSPDSIDMPQYKNLNNQRFISLKQYHRCDSYKSQQRQFLFKIRKSENKKTINTQQDLNTSSKLYIQGCNKLEEQDIRFRSIFQGTFKQRKTFSGEKKQSQWKKLGFDYSSRSKNRQNSSRRKVIEQQKQAKSLQGCFKKVHKSPAQLKYF